jgi:vacuolar-type H+-ATPase subunit H
METTVLQDILEAEKNLDSRIERAKKKADLLVREAEISSKEALEKRKIQLALSHKENMDSFRKLLEEKKGKKLEEARKMVAAIEKSAGKNKEKAVELIYKKFLDGIVEAR